ncbi:unnamed protein product [Clonostachys rosea]|uniref:protein S-acyltransferase n=1 Tax=Bionectria ochroleuca TaxID=29856 RepID=A0ABY6U1V1_BIOOC|nr:unnamed protein product [Clonostachys rosea]
MLCRAAKFSIPTTKMRPESWCPSRVGYRINYEIRRGRFSEKRRYLLEQAASFVDDELGPETTPVHEATRQGSGVQEALESMHIPASEALEMLDATGSAPLHLAVIRGHDHAVQELIDAGADVNCKDFVGLTPLMLASTNGWIDMMQLLLSAGRTRTGRGRSRCRINQRDMKGKTALHYAAKYGYLGAVQLLLEEGADSSAHELFGWTPLHLAVLSGSKGADPAAIEAILQALLDAPGTDIDAQANNGYTPLMQAISDNQLVALQYLTNAGADHTKIDRDSTNILHITALYGKTDILHHLQQMDLNGISVHLRDADGDTPWDSLLFTLEKPHLPFLDLRKATRDESEAFARLLRGVRDRNIQDDLAFLEQALLALPTNDTAAACSFLSNLIATKRKCGELDNAKFYEGIKKDLHANGQQPHVSTAIQDVINDLKEELASDPWGQFLRYDFWGETTLRGLESPDGW